MILDQVYFNPFTFNRIYQENKSGQLDDLHSIYANSGDLDEMPHSDLGLHCLQITLLGVSKLKCVNVCMIQ